MCRYVCSLPGEQSLGERCRLTLWLFLMDEYVACPLKSGLQENEKEKWNKHFVPLTCVRSGLHYTSASSLLLSVHLLVISFFFSSASNLRSCYGVRGEFL